MGFGTRMHSPIYCNHQTLRVIVTAQVHLPPSVDCSLLEGRWHTDWRGMARQLSVSTY
jgi:hypothetical protein